MNKIDIVIPWVDGSDPLWQDEHNKYSPDSNSDNSPERYRDWDTLKYWFRAIEKNAPWVNKIHFATWGHIPNWLNTSNDKLNIVNHKDFIPEKYLPTFSSHTIELNLHRIPDLAEQFIYFNDDVFLTKFAKAEDFFKNNLPCDTASFGIIKNNDTNNFMPYIMLNMLGIINSKFSKRNIIKRDFSKWFSPKYGKLLLNNFYLAPFSVFTGFRNFHTANSFLKSTYQTVWNEIPDILDSTCQRKFRSRDDVNQYIFRYWQLCSGKFTPSTTKSTYLTVGSDSSEKIKKVMTSDKFKTVCVNDDPMEFDFNKEKSNLIDTLEILFPDKSTFEI